MNFSNNPDYLRVTEAATFLGVSSRTIYNMMSDGRLPYSRPGGMYFIRKEDLLALFEPETAKDDEFKSNINQNKEVHFNRCGFCSRAIKIDQVNFQVCKEPGCDRLICQICAANNVIFCALHQPNRDEKLQAAREKFKSGESEVFLEAVTARLFEIKYLSHLEMRIEKLQAIVHPVSNQIINIPNWQTVKSKTDSRNEVLSILGRALIDNETLANYPLNSVIQYKLLAGKKNKDIDFEILINVLSRLEKMTNFGFDECPLGEPELSKLLIELSNDDDDVFKIIVFASTTGWNNQAEELIIGKENAVMGGYVHKNRLVYLFDLQKGKLIFNQFDDRARRYTEIFVPKLPKQEVDEAMKDIAELFILRDSLTLNDAVKNFPIYSKMRLEEAFRALEETGMYSLMEISELGLTLIRK